MKCKICGCQLKGKQTKYCSKCKSEGHKATNKQYCLDNKEKLAKNAKQYQSDNKEKIAEKKKQYYIDNKEKRKQYNIDNKEKLAKNAKQYQSDNKEQIADYQKQYNIDNKDKLTDYKKRYNIDNKEQIAEQKKQYYTDNKEKLAKNVKQYRIDNKEKIAKNDKQHYEDTRDPNTPRRGSKEHRIKVSAAHQGISIDEWDGFATNSPYCEKFNESCRESNRDKYNRECFICGKSESENFTKSGKLRKLSVHHIDMNKQQGCNDNEWKLVPVCLKHHAMLHTELWEARIKYLLRYL